MTVPGPSVMEDSRSRFAAQSVLLQELAGLLAGAQQRLDPLAQFGFVPAGRVEVAGAFVRRGQGQGLQEDRAHFILLFAHHLIKRRRAAVCTEKLHARSERRGRLNADEIFSFVSFAAYCSIGSAFTPDPSSPVSGLTAKSQVRA